MAVAVETLVEEVRRLREGGASRERQLHFLARAIRESCGADQVVVVVDSPANRTVVAEYEGEREGGIGESRASVIISELIAAFSDEGAGRASSASQAEVLDEQGNEPLFVHDLRVARLSSLQREMLENTGILSFALLPVTIDGVVGHLEVQFYTRFARWRREERERAIALASMTSELFVVNADSASIPSASVTQIGQAEELPPAEQDASAAVGSTRPDSVSALLDNRSGMTTQEQYDRLLAYGNLIVVRTNGELAVTEVDGDSEQLLGVPKAQLLGDRGFWFKFLHPLDLRRVVEALRVSKSGGSDLSEEIRVIHQKSGEERWLLLKARQLRDAEGSVRGWEGFGIDVTDRRRVQEQLLVQRKRLEALYEVSRSVQLTSDPAVVALRGLRALIKATGSDSGLSCFYDRTDSSIEVVAAEGLSREYVDDLAHALEGQTLIRTAIDTKEGLILDNIQTDPRAVVDLARREGLRSTILMPLVVEGIVLGAIALFCRRAGQYTKADYDVVGAVSNQIALAARQAEYYAAERRQAASLAALYRLSHELSKHLSAKDVAEHAFPIIQEELASRRMWLGVINEQGTHLVGQAGFGPGVRQSLVSLQVELTNDDDFLNRAIRTRQPVVVEPDQIEQCVKLKRVLTRLKLGTFVVVPLQALSQMVGALVIEPSVSSAFFAQKKLPLLTSMAGEIATVLLARRFEARMSEAEKMRMAGLLASGVAHNFNNMLQAVMGQASLIEMQSAPDSPQRSSAGMILDAATRGAGLVKQLLTFTVQSGHKRERLSLSKLLNESRDLYRSILGAKVQLDIDQGTGDLPDVLADYSQVQHVISNLLVNAREALAEVATGRVQIAIARVALESGEVDPTLPPGDYLRLNVEDNGPGMDAERRARCFEPFYTTKNFDSGTGLGYAGTGLGLSSAYSIMKQHDGSITVQSAPGRGSSFSLFFRAVPPLAVETESPERSLAAGSVALIGWEGDLASPFIAALKGLGVDAVAVTAAEALLPNRVRSIAQHRSVVIDIDAVGTGGISFIQSLKAAQPGLQVALIAKEPTSWSRSCEGLAVTILDRPRGIWALHAVAKRLFGVQARSGLREQLQIESAPVISLESGNSRQDAESQGEGVIVGKVGFGNKGGGS